MLPAVVDSKLPPLARRPAALAMRLATEVLVLPDAAVLRARRAGLGLETTVVAVAAPDLATPAFCATAFFTTGFLATGFFAAVFATADFLAAGFLAVTVFATAFFATAVFATAFFADRTGEDCARAR